MTAFTASNGVTVFVRDGGTLQFQHGTREALSGFLPIMPQSEWWHALREFFRHEEDERLVRWRPRANPGYVVYRLLEPDIVRVVNEYTGESFLVRRGVGPEGTFRQVACAYFDAHPVPKPWDDAKPGDVWVFRIRGAEEIECAATLSEDGHWTWSDGGDVNLSGITDGRCIWPENTDSRQG